MSGQPRTRSAQRAILRVEQLESRDLLSASVPVGPQLLPPQSPSVHMDAIPNDTSFSSQWALNNTGQTGGKVDADIDAAEAWDVTTGSSKNVVSVIDTGIDYRHKDLYRNLWINQGEIPASIRSALIDTDADGLFTFWDLNDVRNQGSGKSVDVNANGRIDGGDLLATTAQGGWANGASDDGDTFIDDLIGWNFVKNNNNPLDDNDHGTHVAGIIGATSNDAVGIAGVDARVQMMAVKVLDASGVGGPALVLQGLKYALDHGAFVANASLSGDYDQATFDFLNGARAKGFILVTAAGNGVDYKGVNIDSVPTYPASYNLPNVVAVAATTSTDELAVSSNYGPNTVDLGAPGRQILSTTRNDKYNTFSGTSMAAPFVTGVLALVRTLHADWQYYQLLDQVLGTVDWRSTLNGKTVTGGRLNAYRAVTEVRGDRFGATVVSAAPNATGARPVSSVRFTFSEAIDASSFTPADVVSFTGPNGPLAVTTISPVANSDGRQFDVGFASQSAAGKYTLQLGTGINDLAGNPLLQGFTTSFEVLPTYTFTSTTKVTLRDVATNLATLTIDNDIPIGDLNVRIDLNHTYDNDLFIHLTSPDGTDVVLVSRRGGSGDNFRNTVLDDEATKAISAGSAPFTGSFRPEMVLSAFDGKSARGTWQLWVEDKQSRDTGTLNSWSLTIEQGLPPASSTVTATSTGHGSVRATSLPDLNPGGGIVSASESTTSLSFLAFAGLPGNEEHSTQPAPAEQAPRHDHEAGIPADAHALDILFAQQREETGRMHFLSEEAPSEDDLVAFFEQDIP